MTAPLWRDWFVFGARWLAIAGFALFVAMTVGDPARMAELSQAVLIAAAANCALGLVLALGARSWVSFVVLLTDWVIVGIFVWISRNAPLVVVAIALTSMMLTLLRPNLLYTAAHIAGLAAIIIYALFGLLARDEIAALIAGDLRLPLIEIGIFSVLVIVSALILERQLTHHDREFALLDAVRSEQMEDIRERTRAIYEMTTTFRETQSFERILNAALDAGQLGLRGRMSKNLVAAVLLFQTDEPGLCVVAARRLTHTDMKQSIPGKSGIIAAALREGVPIVSGRGKQDEELQQFVGFHMTRSTLCVPLRAGYDNFGVLIYGSDTANAFTDEHTELLTAIGVQATIALHNYVLYRSLQEEKERITRVAEDERKQLARQLHDGPTQKVSAIAMMSNVVRRMLERAPERVPDELSKMEEIARSTSKEMRHMLFTLRPLVLESQGLAAALEQLALKMTETHGQKVTVHMQSGIERFLDTHKQVQVFHLIEEAAHNAHKHAKASLISIDVTRQNNDLVVSINDNGVGFDVQAIENGYASRGSLGMLNMRERAALLEGGLQIASERGVGTTITLVAPLIGETPKARVHDDTIVEIPLEKLKVGNSRGRKDGRSSNGRLIHQ
jgi:signal transduction histidine kinase